MKDITKFKTNLDGETESDIFLTDFATRHFKSDFTGTYIDFTESRFMRILNRQLLEYHRNLDEHNIHKHDVKIIDGYADFCKLLIIDNFTDAKTGTLPLTLETYKYLHSSYSSRRKEELPVLSRTLLIPKTLVPKGKYLCIVLYSREQLEKEQDFLPVGKKWGIVSIMSQMTDIEEPMKPITMMRNSLGIDEGGSGVELNRKKYLQSVEFWEKNAMVKII